VGHNGVVKTKYLSKVLTPYALKRLSEGKPIFPVEVGDDGFEEFLNLLSASPDTECTNAPHNYIHYCESDTSGDYPL
jgi:hypothetical protein